MSLIWVLPVKSYPYQTKMVWVQAQAGAIKLTVKQSSLRLADSAPIKKTGKRSAGGSVSVSATKKTQRASDAEIDLRGMNAEEGIMETDRFIDNAVMTGLHTPYTHSWQRDWYFTERYPSTPTPS